MPKLQRFTVIPKIPERLNPLLDIGRNLWWSWTPDAKSLFQRLDPEEWENCRHNPILILGRVGQERMRELSTDDIFLAHMDRVKSELDRYVDFTTWYEKVHRDQLGVKIAYFSAEFGIHECLPLYSGGLGILAGDHLKSASDLGLPLVGVGLCYRVGYFRQYLNRDGWQQETYVENDFYNLPMTLEKRPDGSTYTITVDLAGRPLHARIWRIQVGRVPLFLLDANITENTPEDREITAQLYGGDNEMRMKQEVLLGMGGTIALREMGIAPSVYHMNEGHSAFLALERAAMLMEDDGLSWREAREAIHASNVFTTHTPVPAGNDVFTPELIQGYFAGYCERTGISLDELLALGRQEPRDHVEGFCMTVLALKTAGRANGVSELHGHVSRNMWQRIWPSVPPEEIPIQHITNGIHTQSWFSSEIARLYDRYLGPRWFEDPVDHRIWERIKRIPDSELWRSQDRLRERLVSFARRRLRAQLERRGVYAAQLQQASEILDPDVLTIGFARRFATYKRAALLFRDPERLASIINHPDRPIQVIFAGKAHPRDHLGKELIREVVHLSHRDEFRRRIVFLEDYDIELARVMVQGVDIWLNTPRRPLEASGTSGMKVPVNGGVNLSVLDGWWCEAYNGENGWAIGNGEQYDDHNYQDSVESLALYDLLETEVASTFYRRGSDGLPRDWISILKASMRTVIPNFNTNRMVEDYCEQFYLPASLQWKVLSAENMGEAKRIAGWKHRIQASWDRVRITEVKSDTTHEYTVGEMLPVTVRVELGDLEPTDVTVEAVSGQVDGHGELQDTQPVGLEFKDKQGPLCIFEGSLQCASSGRNGFTVRVIPSMQRMAANRFETRLISWWGDLALQVEPVYSSSDT